MRPAASPAVVFADSVRREYQVATEALWTDFPAGGRLQERYEFQQRWLQRQLLVESGQLEQRQQRVEHELQFGQPQSRQQQQPLQRVLRQAGLPSIRFRSEMMIITTRWKKEGKSV